MAVTDPDEPLADRLERVRHQISLACAAVGRASEEVRLLPVTKTRPVSVLRQASSVGCMQFGENRVQEMVEKAADLPDSVSWVLIGHLQRNKVRQACQVMSELQSLDSLRLARCLEAQVESTSPARRLRVLVEVNTSGESTKGGLPPDEVLGFTMALRAYTHLNPVGLMTVAHPDPAAADRGFATMALLRQQLQDRDGANWSELSMGMSQDFVSAIAHGSTCVRIGTAIFGQR